MLISEAVKIISDELEEYCHKDFIYYYEREGVFEFKRSEDNDYRDISKDDLEFIKKVWVFNKIGIPSKIIKSWFNKDEHAVSFINKRIDELKRFVKKGLI